jgi:hypothetical protein
MPTNPQNQYTHLSKIDHLELQLTHGEIGKAELRLALAKKDLRIKLSDLEKRYNLSGSDSIELDTGNIVRTPQRMSGSPEVTPHPLDRGEGL